LTVSQQMVVHRLSYLLISRLSTICFSTVSPSPLTAEAHHQSPSGSSPYGSRKLGVTNKYISLRFISISISHSVKRSQKPMNMSATNDYEDRNSPMYTSKCMRTISPSILVYIFTVSSGALNSFLDNCFDSRTAVLLIKILLPGLITHTYPLSPFPFSS